MEQSPVEKTYLFNIKNVTVRDLDGVIFQIEIGKPLGNACFMFFSTIEWDGIARKIHAGEPATMTEAELNQLQQLIRSPQLSIMTAVRAALNEYINKLKTETDAVETTKNECPEYSNQ